jgi:hypothetical protein
VGAGQVVDAPPTLAAARRTAARDAVGEASSRNASASLITHPLTHHFSLPLRAVGCVGPPPSQDFTGHFWRGGGAAAGAAGAGAGASAGAAAGAGAGAPALPFNTRSTPAMYTGQSPPRLPLLLRSATSAPAVASLPASCSPPACASAVAAIMKAGTGTAPAPTPPRNSSTGTGSSASSLLRALPAPASAPVPVSASVDSSRRKLPSVPAQCGGQAAVVGREHGREKRRRQRRR